MNKYAGIIAGTLLASGAASAHAEDIVAASTIRAGAKISASDIATPTDREDLRRAMSFIGLEAARTLYKGQPLQMDDLRKPTLVKRNNIVQMTFNKGAMTILAEGRALDDGALGERIRVINLFSKRIVTVTVTGSDSVKANTL